MLTQRLTSAHAFLFCLLVFLTGKGSGVMALEPQAGMGAQSASQNVRTPEAGTPAVGKTSKFLQGSVRDDASLQSSLRVIPGVSARKWSQNARLQKNSFPLGCGVDQYLGSTLKPGGIFRLAPQPANISQTVHIIPPISSRIVTPRNGVMTWSTEYSVQLVPRFSETTNKTPDNAVAYVSRRSGVTSYDSDYSVCPILGKAFEKTYAQRSAASVKAFLTGVASYDPGYDVSPVAVEKKKASGAVENTVAQETVSIPKRSGVTVYEPGYEVSVVAGRDNQRAYAPGYDVSISAGFDGIVCWKSGYEEEVGRPQLAKLSLGGLWFSSPKNQAPPELHATPLKLSINRMPVNLELIAGPRPLKLSARLLPPLHACALNADLSWDDWYKLIGQSIYDRWRYADVGSGTARLRVTITRNRDLSCQVIDFFPAPYAERNVASETAFREAALGAVNLVGKFEIPEFPQTPDLQAVTFDVEMKRTVDGAVGFDIAAAETH